MNEKYKEVLSGISGMDRLFEWLESSDYYSAPASSHFHSACPGGLVLHSELVTKNLLALTEKFSYKWTRLESPYIIGMFHDLCKVNFYTISYRNVKNDKGVWESVPFYKIDAKEPLGHGAKSVILLQQYIRLTPEEIYSIAYHMGAWGLNNEGMADLSAAHKKYPCILLVQLADQLAGIYEDTGKTIL